MEVLHKIEKPEKPAAPERLFSLDLLRGMDVFWLTLLHPLLCAADKTWKLPKWVHAQLVHNWGAFGLFDFAQPLFIFICGAAVPFAIPKRLDDEGRPTVDFWRHVFGRVALLWCCGMLIRSVLLFDKAKFTPYSDTLQTIAAGYFFACMAQLVRWRAVRVALPFVLIGVYVALCMSFGDWSRLGNYPRIVDERAFGALGFKAKDFTYCLTTIAWAGIAMLGSLAAELLKGGLSRKGKTAVLLLFAAGSLSAGYALATTIPVIRHIYSPSFIAISMGYSALSLAICYVVSDVWQKRSGTWLFILFGQTALCAWMLHSNPFGHGLLVVARNLVAGMPVVLGTNHYQSFLQTLVACGLLVWILVLWRRMKKRKEPAHEKPRDENRLVDSGDSGTGDGGRLGGAWTPIPHRLGGQGVLRLRS